nr:transcriptional repressor [Tissierella sp.]
MKTEENITEILKNKEITPSYTRIKIYSYLDKGMVHPTVDEIYMNLSEIFPTLSKTTVYNTLKLFVDKKLVRGVNLHDNKMRYEIVRTDHAHLKCDVCSKIYDIPIDISIHMPQELKGTTIDQQHLLLTGTCSSCLNKAD